MTFWYVGDEEHEDKRFKVTPGGIPAGLGFYVAAGSMCMSKIRGRRWWTLPEEWFIPDEWVNGQCNGARIARGLDRNGILIRVPGEPGYRFRWIRKENTPAAVQEYRGRDRKKHAPKLPYSPGENTPNSPGDLWG